MMARRGPSPKRAEAWRRHREVMEYALVNNVSLDVAQRKVAMRQFEQKHAEYEVELRRKTVIAPPAEHEKLPRMTGREGTVIIDEFANMRPTDSPPEKPQPWWMRD